MTAADEATGIGVAATVADLAGRGLDDLRNVVELLGERGRLARVRTSVDPELELGGVARRFHGGKAVVFDKVKGSRFPVLTGLYWNRGALADVFGVSEERLPFLVADAVAQWQQSPLAPLLVKSAPVQEVIEKKVDLGRYPISRVGLEEGGPYMTAPVVIAKDPDTGVRNACIVRWMVTGRDRLAFLLDMGRHLRDYYERAEARGEPLQVTINVGVNPAVHFAAVVPPSAAPIDTDELGIAGHLLGRPLELVPGRTVDVEGVASAQFILEAELLPHVREPEGPAAEVTGYYAERADRWVARVTGITRREQPLWHTIIPGQEVYNAVGLVAEASIFRLVSRQIPGLLGREAFLRGVRLLPRRGEDAEERGGHAEERHPGHVRSLPLAQAGDRGRRRRGYPRPPGRRVGHGHALPARPRHHPHPRGTGSRTQPHNRRRHRLQSGLRRDHAHPPPVALPAARLHSRWTWTTTTSSSSGPRGAGYVCRRDPTGRPRRRPAPLGRRSVPHPNCTQRRLTVRFSKPSMGKTAGSPPAAPAATRIGR